MGSERGSHTNPTNDVSVPGEILGVEHSDGILYLLVYSGTGPELLEISESGTTRTPIHSASAGELISLQLWSGHLLALDYQAGTIYELIPGEVTFGVKPFLDLDEVVPPEERADGGIRGMCFTDAVWYFTSLSFNGEQGELHVVVPQD